MSPENFQNAINRRTFLGNAGLSLGSASLASLLGQSAFAGPETLGFGASEDAAVSAARRIAPKAKRVIFLCMAGGPSHLETLDYKPKLAEMDGKPMPESVTAGQPIAQLQGKKLVCLGPRAKFTRSGKSGQMISDYFPHTQKIADDICIVRSLKTEQINHDPAHTFMNTGSGIPGRPSMGAWINYGLGRENQDLPGFVVMTSVGGRNPQPIAARQWAAGFLPSRYQGVELRSHGDPVLYLGNPAGVSRPAQGQLIGGINALNREFGKTYPDPELDTRIAQYELAFRMQASVPELMDISDEPQEVLDMYGTKGADGSFASNCLLARRLAERGVRFIHLYHRGWDHHGGLDQYMKVCSGLVDQGSAALVADLKRRGMLEDTLVIWGGEFGRTPMGQTGKGSVGRDHHMRAFSMWMAGGGIKGGVTYGETDEFGYQVAKDPVHVHDLHATMLHLLGIDHEKMTVKFQGRDYRLTDVHGKIIKGILA